MDKKVNDLTHLLEKDAFFEETDKFLKGVRREEYCMLAVNIQHFRLYNDIRGREQGDSLLALLAIVLSEFCATHNGLAGYIEDDSFAVIMQYGESAENELREQLQRKIYDKTKTIGYHPVFGIYHIRDNAETPKMMYDHAAMALSHINENYVTRSCEYYSDMDVKYEEEVHQLSEIHQGIDADEFTFFLQPQCDIIKTKIVGAESLVRWIKKDGTIVPPGKFIPLLERSGFIADLDVLIWEKVCKWLRKCIDKGYQPVPVSINVSRIDIFSLDVPEFLSDLVKKYDIDTNLIKVEITESAYAENEDTIIGVAKKLQEYGFLVMMDDFGSGYSSLNMLNSVPVDVLKIDMRFLEISEKEEEKGVGILESVVNMARQMKVPIVVEGVEFKKHEELLLRMGCQYTQGFYYYRPMETQSFEKILSDGRDLDHEGFWCRQSEPLHIREFLDRNVFSDATINNILGPVAFYDMYENNIEITRVNEQYLSLIGLDRNQIDSFRRNFWVHVRDDDRQLLFSIFYQAYEHKTSGVTDYIHLVNEAGETVWVKIHVFFLREKEGHKYFCGKLFDVTEAKRKHKQEIVANVASVNFDDDKLNQLQESYGRLPCGYAVSGLVLDDGGTPVDFELLYANDELQRLCGGDTSRLYFMLKKLFDGRMTKLLDKAYSCAYLGERMQFHTYSNISERYLDLSMYQYEYGYLACVVNDVTHSRIYQNSMSAVMSTLREAYFLHLQDNYCRMIHPDENHLLDRGNYEEIVERHFANGKIRPYDEKSVREFLSLDRLRKALEKEDSVEFKYRRSIEPGGEEWCLTTVQVSERDGNVPQTAIITIRSIESLMREQADTKYQTISQMLSQMSEGFFVYCADAQEEIMYANPKVLKIFGCDSVEEFKTYVHNSFAGMVYPDDLKRVEWEISEQIAHSDKKMDYICYRIKAKDGSLRWIEDCGHLEDPQGGPGGKLFYVFIADITDNMTKESLDNINKLNEKFNG